MSTDTLQPMDPQRESELAAEVQAQAEELAELRAAISETCTLLGQEGQDADDLRDAVGQLERLVDGKDRDGIPLTGLAAKLRQRLYQTPSARDAIITLYLEPRDKASNASWGAVLCTHFGLDVSAIRREVFDSGTSK